MTYSPSTTLSEANGTSFNIQGKIIRKKNISSEYLKLAIQQDNHEQSTTVYLPRNDISTICTPQSSDVNFLYLGSIIHVKGYTTTTNNIATTTDEKNTAYHHATQCNLVKCSPNAKLIKEILALSNYTSFASTLCMDEDELQQLVNDEKSTQKIIVHTIIERITGQSAKAPPKYRPGRVKRSDMDILEQKEAEGRRNVDDYTKDNLAVPWQLCQPCQPVNNIITTTKKKKESSVVNLPTGSEDLLSAHGKLTRSEYLETKKNNQSAWFIQRIKQFDIYNNNNNNNEVLHQSATYHDQQQGTIRFLDVGGGRGDLAVQIALNFSNAIVIVVDCNANSIRAGEEFATKCGVDDRIEFHCMNFTEYSKNKNRIDFVVALHACGDLSDMALNFAHTYQTNFIIVPCCYPKRYLTPFFTPYWYGLCKNDNEINSLSRLVELDDHRDVSRRAMLVINSMRQCEFVDKETSNVVHVALEEFDCKISKRNIALVGRKTAK